MDASIPPELLLPTPRTLRRRTDAKIGCVVPAVLAVLFAVIAVLSIWAIVEPIMIVSARQMTGIVTNLHTSQGSRGHTTYQVGYRYLIDGQDQSDSESVGASIYRQLKIGQPVQVRVFQSAVWQTSWLELLWQHYAAERWAGWAIAGFFDAALLLVLWSIRRQRSLLRSGRPTIGRLVSKRITRGKTSSYWVTYEFTAGSGETVRKTATVNQTFYGRYEPGSSLCVVYDPNHPKRALLYGTIWFECAGGTAR